MDGEKLWLHIQKALRFRLPAMLLAATWAFGIQTAQATPGLGCPPGEDCSQPPSGLICPQTGGVLLYKTAEYGCGFDVDTPGFFRQRWTGFSNLPEAVDDQVSSLRVPGGWSVTVFEHHDAGGGRRCIASPGQVSFAGLAFDNGQPLEDRVSSMRVFANPDCSPATPGGLYDNTSPEGNFVDPQTGITTGRFLTITAQAGDAESGVARVFFYGEWEGQGHLLGVDGSAPYVYTWDLCNAPVPNGQVRLGLQVIDWSGNRFVLPPTEEPIFFKSYDCSQLWPGGGQPPDALPPDETAPMHFWRGAYFRTQTSTTPDYVRLELDELDHNWSTGSPLAGFPVDGFRTQFTRTADFDCGLYQFHIRSDDGFRFWIDGQTVVDNWQDGSWNVSENRQMTRGEHLLRLDQYENQGLARVGLFWEKLSNCPVDLSALNAVQVFVRPQEWFTPTLRLQVDQGYLDPLRNDALAWVDGLPFGADQVMVRDQVDTGERYAFGGNSSEPFRMWAGDSGGVFTSGWQIRLGDGELVGPQYDLQVVVDGAAPSLQIDSPAVGAILAGSAVQIEATGQDNLSGLDEVQFFSGYADLLGWRWHWLGSDTIPGDGWSSSWRLANVPSQHGAVIMAYGRDQAGNTVTASVTDLVITRPESKYFFLPLIPRSVQEARNRSATFNSLAEDGSIERAACYPWDSCREAGAGGTVQPGSASGSVKAVYLPSSFWLSRVYLFFDTSVLPDSAEITAAKLSIYVGPNLTGSTRFHLVPSTAGRPLAPADFDRVAFVSLGSAAPGQEGWVEMDLDDTGMAYLRKDGVTTFGLLHGLDFGNVAPSAPNSAEILFSESGERSPKLQISYR